eukprot:m.30144 g.30144  ORF g.30144 m.30144 type:complete len:311 (+) comp8176_c0_seq1:72-1004(+)
MSEVSFKRPPKTRAGKQALEKREPKLVENTKTIMLLFGKPSTQIHKDIFRDFAAITQPHSKIFDRKKEIRPFEDTEPLEYLSKKNDASLFIIGTHNKKRPQNLVFGRLFDHQMLDMIEVGVEGHKLLKDFKTTAHAIGSKPCLIFNGEEFENQAEFIQFKSMLVDFFQGDVVSNISLEGIDHVISFVATTTANKKKVLMRHFKINLKKSGTRTPNVELEEMGPRLDMALRRVQTADPDLMKQAMKQPKALKPKKRKNIETNELGDTIARVHMKKQDVSKLQTRKVKALKGSKKQKAAPSGEDEEMELEED